MSSDSLGPMLLGSFPSSSAAKPDLNPNPLPPNPPQETSQSGQQDPDLGTSDPLPVSAPGSDSVSDPSSPDPASLPVPVPNPTSPSPLEPLQIAQNTGSGPGSGSGLGSGSGSVEEPNVTVRVFLLREVDKLQLRDSLLRFLEAVRLLTALADSPSSSGGGGGGDPNQPVSASGSGSAAGADMRNVLLPRQLSLFREGAALHLVLDAPIVADLSSMVPVRPSNSSDRSCSSEMLFPSDPSLCGRGRRPDLDPLHPLGPRGGHRGRCDLVLHGLSGVRLGDSA